MPTIYQRAVRNSVHAGIRDIPQFGPSLITTLDRMNQGIYPRHFVDAVVQRRGSEWDIYDAFSVAWVDAHIRRGKLAHLTIPVARGACPDRDVDGNNAILSRLPAPFRAVFRGGWGDQDGSLEWGEPTPFLKFVPGSDGTPGVIDLPAGIVPLEVGDTNYGRTEHHIVQQGGVARLPYDCGFLTIFRRIPGADGPAPAPQPSVAGAGPGAAGPDEFPDLRAFWNRRKLRKKPVPNPVPNP